jgi:hypothetical protein
LGGLPRNRKLSLVLKLIAFATFAIFCSEESDATNRRPQTAQSGDGAAYPCEKGGRRAVGVGLSAFFARVIELRRLCRSNRIDLIWQNEHTLLVKRAALTRFAPLFFPVSDFGLLPAAH